MDPGTETPDFGEESGAGPVRCAGDPGGSGEGNLEPLETLKSSAAAPRAG